MRQLRIVLEDLKELTLLFCRVQFLEGSNVVESLFWVEGKHKLCSLHFLVWSVDQFLYNVHFVCLLGSHRLQKFSHLWHTVLRSLHLGWDWRNLRYFDQALFARRFFCSRSCRNLLTPWRCLFLSSDALNKITCGCNSPSYALFVIVKLFEIFFTNKLKIVERIIIVPLPIKLSYLAVEWKWSLFWDGIWFYFCLLD